KAAAERDDTLHSNWMYNASINFTADQLVILDESSKDGQTLIRHYGRAPSGHDPVLCTSLDWGIQYSILPALTIDGYITI
ncbi:hypothetical protein H0H87_012578, partial [Tephrocybe sp. NHM501043]